MLKRTINYEDFNGEKKSVVRHFHLSEPELIEMEVEVKGGFAEHLKSIAESDDKNALIKEFKRIILMAYGEKSVDGESFVKSQELCDRFAQTAAYNALFMELATDDNAAAEFIVALMPKNMQGRLNKELSDKSAASTLPAPVIPEINPQ